MKQRVLLGMSSGIDSSVSAILLKNKGLEVVGVTFIFSEADYRKDEMIESASQLAEYLNIEYHVIDLRTAFQNSVISYFQREYLNGKTPFPCAVCNPQVKFKNLIYHADKLNCKFISTGHYVKVTENEGYKYISKSLDKDKDQSFFLWGLSSSVLERLILPLADYKKAEVREIAKQHGFPQLTTKKESLGICFVESNDYRKYLKDKGIQVSKGNFVNKEGEVLGQHNGYINYTIGQRRGLGLNLNFPMFVSDIFPDKNEVVLAEFNELKKTIIRIENYHFVHPQMVNTDKNYIVKIRYRLQENQCRIRFLENGQVEIHLNEPVAMVANGQTAVLYDDNRVIGGGFIAESK